MTLTRLSQALFQKRRKRYAWDFRKEAVFQFFDIEEKNSSSEAMTRLDGSMSDFRKKNQHFQVWIPLKLTTDIEAELKRFGGENKREQFITFWNWYFHAKEENKLLKPENKEELPQSPDAPRCKYHTFSEDQWYCNREKIPREVCLQSYRNFRKDCVPRHVMEKRLIEETRQEQRQYSGRVRSVNIDAVNPDGKWKYPEARAEYLRREGETSF